MTSEYVRRGRRCVWVATGCALLAIGAGASRLHAQQATKPAVAAGADAAAVAGKLSGSWAFNKEQSTDPNALRSPDVGETGRPNGSGGGNRGGGGGFGGLGSILGGGRGGMGGGRGGEVRESSGTTEEQRAVQALTTELRDTPLRLTIAASAGTITITPDDNDPRVFAIRNIKEKVDLLLAKVDVTSRWEGAALVQQFDAGSPLKLLVTYALSADGKQLDVTIVATRPKNQGGEAKPIIRVYDRAQ